MSVRTVRLVLGTTLLVCAACAAPESDQGSVDPAAASDDVVTSKPVLEKGESFDEEGANRLETTSYMLDSDWGNDAFQRVVFYPAPSHHFHRVSGHSCAERRCELRAEDGRWRATKDEAGRTYVRFAHFGGRSDRYEYKLGYDGDPDGLELRRVDPSPSEWFQVTAHFGTYLH